MEVHGITTIDGQVELVENDGGNVPFDAEDCKGTSTGPHGASHHFGLIKKDGADGRIYPPTASPGPFSS